MAHEHTYLSLMINVGSRKTILESRKQAFMTTVSILFSFCYILFSKYLLVYIHGTQYIHSSLGTVTYRRQGNYGEPCLLRQMTDPRI